MEEETHLKKTFNEGMDERLPVTGINVLIYS